MYMDDGSRLIALASSRITGEETSLAIALIDAALKQDGSARPSQDFMQLATSSEHSTALNTLALYVHRVARDLSATNSAASRAPLARSLLHVREQLLSAASKPRASAGAPSEPVAVAEPPITLELGIIRVYERTVRRSPVEAEIEIWKTNFRNGLSFHEFMILMERSPESANFAKAEHLLADASDGEFILTAYEIVNGRGAAAWEVDHWQRRMEKGDLTRTQILAEMFASAAAFYSAHAETAVHDGLSCLVMGTGMHVTAEEWRNKALALRDAPAPKRERRFRNSFQVRGEPRFLVSALASMYRGADFIEQFMDNITGQDRFDDYCELVIVDADSPENEYDTIKRYLAKHRNINYIRCNYRLGIYDAWNVAAKASRGEYLTNTNMDDLRRHDSFMLQAGVLENLPFVDVAYQELYYTFDPRLSFAQIEDFELKTALPVITPHNMILFNSPHNAPMWRKRLHDELGYFNTHYRSAGDYDFWLRCLHAGKKFYKVNDPHVVYYQNPKGLSTRPDTRGVIESMEIHREYCRKLMPEDVVMPRGDFIRKLDPSANEVLYGHTRDRYVLAQEALRNAARHRKFASQGVRP